MSPSETSSTLEPAGAACCGVPRLSVMRQAQLAAGGLALLGFALGTLLAPGWHALSGIVGLGLLHAGFTGGCGMASLLARMPWNKGAPAV